MEYRRGSPSVSPAAATNSGDGVSPAARAAASGSLPGSAAATASADAGRRAGSGSRHWRIDPFHRRIDIGAKEEILVELRGFLLLQQLADAVGFVRLLPGEQLVQHQAERVDVALRGDTGSA